MRTLLYFKLEDAATARRAQMQLSDLVGTPALVAGPWFVQRDNQPVEGLPRVAISQTTYREEVAIIVACASAIVAALMIFRYGVSTGTGPMAAAYVGGVLLGAMIGWWLGTLAGARIERFGLRRHTRQLAPGQLMMIASCDTHAKEPVKQMVQGLGGIGIDEHNDRMQNLRWNPWSA